MDVFLIRHAEAIDETLELRDPMRHLTAHGREQARSLGDRLRWLDCVPTHIWTSPLVRAVQTAELVAAGLGSTISVEVVPALAGVENTRLVIAAVQSLPDDTCAVLVGHEPGMSALGAVLASRPEFEALAKAEAARITAGALRWRFAWNGEAPTPARDT